MSKKLKGVLIWRVPVCWNPPNLSSSAQLTATPLALFGTSTSVTVAQDSEFNNKQRIKHQQSFSSRIRQCVCLQFFLHENSFTNTAVAADEARILFVLLVHCNKSNSWRKKLWSVFNRHLKKKNLIKTEIGPTEHTNEDKWKLWAFSTP